MELTAPRRKTRQAAQGCVTRRAALVGGLGVAGLISPGFAQAAHQVRPWSVGKPTPALALTGLNGKPWSLESAKGRPLIVNFWATWCEPCRAEMPTLELLATRHERAGLMIVAVDYKEAPAKIQQFLQVLPISLPILLDPDGDAASAWTPRVFPTSVLIGRDGVPRSTVVGEMDWMDKESNALIAPLLASR